MTLKAVSRVKSITRLLIKFAKLEWIVKIDCKDILLSKSCNSTWIPQIIHIPPPPLSFRRSFLMASRSAGLMKVSLITTSKQQMRASCCHPRALNFPAVPMDLCRYDRSVEGALNSHPFCDHWKLPWKRNGELMENSLFLFFLFTAKWAGTTLHRRKLVWNGWRSSAVFQWNFNGYGIC